MISYEDFAKLDLRVGTVKSAERVESSEKLLKLTIDIGEERIIVAGLGKNYNPEELLGKQIVVIANLEPRKLMGIESQGMVLAAESSDGPVVLIPDKLVDSGAQIK